MGDTPSYIKTDPAYLSENYNKDHRMAIDLAEMYDAGHVRIDFLADAIGDAWTAAMSTWNDLLLSWSGDSADASKVLQEKISDVQLKLFGKASATDPTKADPIGILGQIQTLVGTANLDLDLAETSVKKSFDQMTDSANRSAGGGEVIWFDVNKDGKGDLALPGGKQAADQTGPVSETYGHPIDRGHTEGTHVGAPEPSTGEYKSPEDIQREELRRLGEEKKNNPQGPRV